MDKLPKVYIVLGKHWGAWHTTETKDNAVRVALNLAKEEPSYAPFSVVLYNPTEVIETFI
jgi:hypothetical protein